VDAVIAALISPDPDDDFPALLHALEVFQATDFPTRAAAIAGEIARTRPMVVGLQEVSRISVDLTALGMPVAFTVDFEPILASALAARGLDYVKVAENTNIDISVLPAPLVTTLRDKDVLLARGDLVPSSAGGKSYDICLGPVPACPITIPAPLPIGRGYVWAEILVNDVPWTFVATHLEDGDTPDFAAIRAVELSELIGRFAAAPGPVVVMGDFNDPPEEDGDPGPDAYDLMTAGGYTDVWRAMRPGVVGYTCCHASDLTNLLPSLFHERIDFVFARNVPSGEKLFGTIDIVGKLPSERTGATQPRWASDHAGLAATLFVPAGR
jgi:endonuclease/exonuclease/phosphatase family metal-dependent hydrolase